MGLNTTERAILMELISLPVTTASIPKIMSLERAFCSVAGRKLTDADIDEVKRKGELTNESTK